MLLRVEQNGRMDIKEQLTVSCCHYPLTSLLHHARSTERHNAYSPCTAKPTTSTSLKSARHFFDPPDQRIDHLISGESSLGARGAKARPTSGRAC